jgi:hypothetical protein
LLPADAFQDQLGGFSRAFSSRDGCSHIKKVDADVEIKLLIRSCSLSGKRPQAYAWGRFPVSRHILFAYGSSLFFIHGSS